MKPIFKTLSLITMMLAPAAAHAGGLFVPLGGVLNTGRAGAGVVSTRDPNAIAYNPPSSPSLKDTKSSSTSHGE